MSPRMPRDVADGEWVNPYRVTMRSADTLNLVAEGRLYIHIHQTWNEEAGRFGPTERRWVLIGGSVGWRNEALAWANRFLDAGMIDYNRPAGIGLDEPHPQLRNKTRVFLTQAGRYLFQTWHHRPFEVIEVGSRAELLDKAAASLAAAYVEESGLLEDRPDRYVAKLRPHAERVLDDLTGR
jgi:hypothetical protein